MILILQIKTKYLLNKIVFIDLIFRNFYIKIIILKDC